MVTAVKYIKTKKNVYNKETFIYKKYTATFWLTLYVNTMLYVRTGNWFEYFKCIIIFYVEIWSFLKSRISRRATPLFNTLSCKNLSLKLVILFLP